SRSRRSAANCVRAKSCALRPGLKELRQRETRSPVGSVLRAHRAEWVQTLVPSRARRPYRACTLAVARRRNATLRRRLDAKRFETLKPKERPGPEAKTPRSGA